MAACSRSATTRSMPRRWRHGIAPIDLLVVNLYPFEATVANGAGYDDCIENIDIGGPAMIRAAAKNHAYVAVVIEPDGLCARAAPNSSQNGGTTTLALRKKLAAKAYARTAAYDAAISNWFAETLERRRAGVRAFGGKLARRCATARTRTRARLLSHARQARRRRHRAAGAGQAALLQQHQRHRRGLRMRRRVRSQAHRRRRHHQARQSVRRGGRRAASSRPTARRWPAIRPRRSAASSRSTARSMPKPRAPSPRFSPK